MAKLSEYDLLELASFHARVNEVGLTCAAEMFSPSFAAHPLAPVTVPEILAELLEDHAPEITAVWNREDAPARVDAHDATAACREQDALERATEESSHMAAPALPTHTPRLLKTLVEVVDRRVRYTVRGWLIDDDRVDETERRRLTWMARRDWIIVVPAPIPEDGAVALVLWEGLAVLTEAWPRWEPADRALAEVVELLVLAASPDSPPVHTAEGWRLPCPTHGEPTTLRLARGDRGRAEVSCERGCTRDGLVAALSP